MLSLGALCNVQHARIDNWVSKVTGDPRTCLADQCNSWPQGTLFTCAS